MLRFAHAAIPAVALSSSRVADATLTNSPITFGEKPPIEDMTQSGNASGIGSCDGTRFAKTAGAQPMKSTTSEKSPTFRNCD